MHEKRGSIWRVWDLHVHTPGTKLEDGYGGTSAENWNRFVQILEQSNVSAFGITDYFSIDGYRYLTAKQRNEGKLKQKALFPNIELRLDQSANKDAEEINIHLIFDNAEELEKKIEAFLRGLPTINTKLDDTKYHCSPEELRELGYKKACVQLETVKDTLIEIFGKEKPYLIFGVAGGYGGIRPDAKSPRKVGIAEEIDKHCDAFFGRSQDKDHFLKEGRYEDAMQKAVVAGSDSHSFAHLENYLGKEFFGEDGVIREVTWIKADLTFQGLKQILYEPESRVFIGGIPEKLEIVAQSPRLFIESVGIATTKNDAEWFDKVGEVQLNPDLVSIIGNKGTGKSALADIIAMTGNSKTETLSFLNTDKFLALAAHSKYTGIIKLKDGTKPEKPFGSPGYDPTDETYVVYLSHDFVREMCDSENVAVLRQEIDRVIFDRIPLSERMNFESVSEMISELGSNIDEQIRLERNALQKLNGNILKHEDYLKPAFKSEKERLHNEKERELQALETTGKPKEVKPPSKSQNEKTIEQIAALREQLPTAQETISGIDEKIAVLYADEKELVRLQLQVDGFRSQLDAFTQSLVKNNVALKYGIDVALLKIKDPLSSPISDIIDKVKGQAATLKKEKQDLEKKKTSLEDQVKKLQATLTAKEKEYQAYLNKLAKWEEKRKAIVGDDRTAGTVAQLKRWLEFIDKEAQSRLNELEAERTTIANKIAGLLFKKKSLFEGIYLGIREHTKNILEETSIGEKEFISVDTGLTIAGDFEGRFLSMINQKRKGTFSGVATGARELKKLIAANGVTDERSVGQLPDSILGALESDLTVPLEDRQNLQIEDQLVEDVKTTKEALYNYIYSLEYFETRAEITYFGKSLRNLSPGEKGTVLLVFFLLMDFDRRPIIIDQPEENLDNETVFRILVPLIKKVKSERQIIIVTHNPNLAVVTDSEQIIRCSIDKEHGNLISYSSGSIELSQIREAVVDVLEGTERAFVNRRDKYELKS
jgi:hypothetical protein